jgi:hypothetical protein
VWFAWRAENDEIEVPKKSAETGGHQTNKGKMKKIKNSEGKIGRFSKSINI